MALQLLEDIDCSNISVRARSYNPPTGPYKGYTILNDGKTLKYSLGERRVKIRENKRDANKKSEITIQVHFDDDRGFEQIKKFEEIRLAACKYSFEKFRDDLNMPEAIDSAEDMFKMGIIKPTYYRKRGVKKEPGDKTEVVYFKTFDDSFGYPTTYKKYETVGNGGYRLKDLNPRTLIGKSFNAIVQCTGGRFTSHANTRITPNVNRLIILSEADGAGDPEDDPTFAALCKDRKVVASEPASEEKAKTADAAEAADAAEVADGVVETEEEDDADDEYMDLSQFVNVDA